MDGGIKCVTPHLCHSGPPPQSAGNAPRSTKRPVRTSQDAGADRLTDDAITKKCESISHQKVINQIRHYHLSNRLKGGQ